MIKERGRLREGRGNEALGIVLILFGILFFVGHWFDFQVGQYGWPFFIIVPGVLLLIGGFFTGERAGALLPVGSAVTMVGLILFFQNTTTLWATWAYVWALIPSAVGLGLIGHGLLHGDKESTQSGTRVLMVGLLLFISLGFFFEVIIGLSGFTVGYPWADNLWPLLLIGAGLLLLARDFFGSERA